jgi:hypothetical protein
MSGRDRLSEREIYRNTVIKERREREEEANKFNVKKKEREKNRRTQRKKN